MKALLFIVFLLVNSVTYGKLVESIYFETDSSIVLPSEVVKLENVQDAVFQGRYDIVILVGSADRRASNSYNFDLAKRRAGAVKEFLESMGVKEKIKITVSSGEEEPVSEDLAKNRRVDIHVFAKKVENVDNNMLILHLGIMPHGVKALETAPHRVKIGQKIELGAGATYMRRITGCFHLGSTVMTNPTFTVNFGCSF